MAKVKIFLDPIGNIMNIWWGNPNDAYRSEEVDDLQRNDVIIKDKADRPISIEIVGIFPKELNVSELVKKIKGGSHKEPFLLHG